MRLRIAHSAPERRTLSGLDLAILWGDLSVGLLVIVTGALLVPALGIGPALLAILLGTLLGCLPLALVAFAGERERVPTMVLLRPVLGGRGSFLPSALNLVQQAKPVQCDAKLKDLLRQSIDEAGFESIELVSGAGHDAAAIAAAGIPTAMVFVRNGNGSHNPHEAMAVSDLDEAVRLLTALARVCLS